MFLILAIEPDRRQANRLFALGRGQLRGAELVLVDNIEAGLDVLAGRVPDLVLTSLLLSAKDDAALADRLRELDAAGHQVQTLVVPLFAGPTSQGCQPPVFAAQLNEYLENLRLDREAREPQP